MLAETIAPTQPTKTKSATTNALIHVGRMPLIIE
uniref:Uncharacterized protein n=1 Tax=Nelumbo nucifera TaxID=4432 RepID=A0A822X910_NELNU|nr:TPA_asm: hypothetical protein HUJ06_019397 [Nelumbo nucifera]